MIGSMATIPLPPAFQRSAQTGKIAADQLRLYDEFGIEVPFNRSGEPESRWFRISAQIYDTLAEYEYLAEALQVIARAI